VSGSPIDLGRLGFGWRFGVKLAVLWAIGADVPPRGYCGKLLKRLKKIE
jgi:hypothetical protein